MSPPPLVMPVVQNSNSTNSASASAPYAASSSSSTSSTTLDGLPKQFVVAMRTLFDIMDDKGAGFVKFSDIEDRWQDDGTKGLPKGVIESLRKVTPPNGLLSFERFCAGLKICLLKNQVEGRSSQSVRNLSSDQPITSAPTRPTSAPLLDIDHHKPSSTQWSNPNTATVRPNNAISSSVQSSQVPTNDATLGIPIVKQHHHGPLYGPPKPPRTNLIAVDRSSNSNLPGNELRNPLDKQEIRTVLHNWQLGLMNTNNSKSSTNLSTLSDQPPQHQLISNNSNGGSNNNAITNSSSVPLLSGPLTVGHHKKLSGGASGRRKEPRRHTLQNGIDYNMLKRMKQIEQEKEVLMQGLQAVERARDWYIKQITNVQEKMKYLGRMPSHMEQWSEAQQERLELQRARVLEVNRHLATLTDCGERGGLPLHMNLAINHHHHHHLSHPSPHVLSRLKQQNHLLNEELSKKSERITLLEREKASLIRELFQSRAQIRKTDQQSVPQLQDGFM